tara:strand:+ start:2107 stop:3186 length:1080 start_codon:yes stop_codon:yes gene_type:complete
MRYYFIILFSITQLFSQDIIGEGLSEQTLINYLVNNYKTSNVMSYANARDVLYGEVDKMNGQVKGVYTNYAVTLPNGVDPSTHLYENGIDCEHVWPQSMGASGSPMKSDMHHLRPCKSNVNSSRGNSPFSEVANSQVNHWYWLNYDVQNTPSQNIDEYSKSASGAFEPREDMKGDIARAMFYFYTMYSDVADQSFYQVQKDILYQWHQEDPINILEIQRTEKIADYQDYPNPFILDETLIYRCYFYEDIYGCQDQEACNYNSDANMSDNSCEYSEENYNCNGDCLNDEDNDGICDELEEGITGDVNQDDTINILDIIYMMNYVLNLVDFSQEEITLSDINGDGGVNILDIVLLIEEIIS